MQVSKRTGIVNGTLVSKKKKNKQTVNAVQK